MSEASVNKTIFEKDPPQRQVIVQPWTESERGMGKRPDGCSIHLCDEDRLAFIQGYSDTFNNAPETPDEYSYADGAPYIGLVSEVQFQLLLAVTKADDDLPWRKFGVFLGPGARQPAKFAEMVGVQSF